MTTINKEGRRYAARSRHVHDLVALNEQESKNKCWRTDVSDKEWLEGSVERFGRLLVAALKKPTDMWTDALGFSGIDVANLSENQIRAYLAKVRWNGDPVCPRCGCVRCYTCSKPNYKCSRCRRTFTLMFGTVFQDRKVPLKKLMLFMDLLCRSKNVSILQIKWSMATIAYKAADYLAKRCRRVFDSIPPLG